jgi:hypothetical protein
MERIVETNGGRVTENCRRVGERAGPLVRAVAKGHRLLPALDEVV